MNYDIVTLSINEKMKFFIKGFFISFSISYLFYNNLWIGVLISLVYSMTIGEYKRKIRDKRKEEMLIEFRDLLYSISSSMSTGRSMEISLKEAIDYLMSTNNEKSFIIIELKNMVKMMEETNMNDIDVLKDFAKRTNLPDIKNFVLTYVNAKETGFNEILAINRAADIISEKILLEKELRSSLKEKEFESKIVTYAPFIIIMFLRLTNGGYMNAFLNTMKGHIIATISLSLIGLSRIISERIVKIEI